MSVADTRTLTRMLGLLSHPRRRFVLYSLQSSQGSLHMDALARRIAMWEASDGTGEPTESAVGAVSASLHHTHLPKLDEAGLLVYDATRDHVACGEQAVPRLPLDDELRLERERVLSTGR